MTGNAITHVVQARAMGLGWVDWYPACSLKEAQAAEMALKESKTVWMEDATNRQTRIVPVNESRCAAMYTNGPSRCPLQEADCPLNP